MITLRHKRFKIISFVFNWRIMALQCCIGFCHTSPWVSHRYTYDPSLVNPPPTSPHPLACRRAPGLSALCRAANLQFIHFANSGVYVSMVFFQSVSASPSPLCPVLRVCVFTAPCSSVPSFQTPHIYIHCTMCIFQVLQGPIILRIKSSPPHCGPPGPPRSDPATSPSSPSVSPPLTFFLFDTHSVISGRIRS